MQTTNIYRGGEDTCHGWKVLNIPCQETEIIEVIAGRSGNHLAPVLTNKLFGITYPLARYAQKLANPINFKAILHSL